VTIATQAGTGRRARLPAALTGFGLGAFLDGIVLHQVLQWHHLVVARTPADDLDGLQANVVWDGVFHLASWVAVLVGVLWLVRRAADVRALGTRRTVGLMLVGWGAFNVVDEIVFHLLLDAHHIRMVDDYLVYDLAYTALGVVLVGVGALLGRRS
jgi:uncharacterized membrane protein